MATFTVGGYEIRSDSSKTVTQTATAQLQYVSPLGTSSLDYRYTFNDPDSAEVSLTDYNLLLNGTHLNDAPLPDRIEIFTLSWASEGTPQKALVMNLTFGDTTDEDWRDCLFSIEGAELPDLTNAQMTEAFFKAAVMTVPAEAKYEDFTIDLEKMPGVEVTGVIARMFAEQDIDSSGSDQFNFATQSDIGQDIFLQDYVVLHEEAPQLAATATIDPPADEVDDALGAFLPETGYDDFAS